MTRYKVSELEGALLDAAVAKAEGLAVHPGPGRYLVAASVDTRWAHEFMFSSSWADGGPIIERERIAVVYIGDPWLAECPNNAGRAKGPTPLIAAMRAYVASKFGDTVELP